MGYYVTVDQVRGELSPADMIELFDDENAGEVASANPSLQLAMRKAHAEMTSELATIYVNPPPELAAPPSTSPEPAPVGEVPDLFVVGELAYVRFFAFQRKPAYAVKVGGEKYLESLWTFAQKRMDRIKDSLQTVAASDSPPSPTPSNVGGITVRHGPLVTFDHTGRASGDF